MTPRGLTLRALVEQQPALWSSMLGALDVAPESLRADEWPDTPANAMLDAASRCTPGSLGHRWAQAAADALVLGGPQ